jgi:hypothetical protein
MRVCSITIISYLRVLKIELTPWSIGLSEKITGHQLLKKFPAICATWRFITACTRVRHFSLFLARSIQSISPHSPQSHIRDFFVWFVIRLSFYDEELLAPRPNPKTEDHTLSAVRDCLFVIFAASIHIWKPFLQAQPEYAPCCGDSTDLQVLLREREHTQIACRVLNVLSLN